MSEISEMNSTISVINTSTSVSNSFTSYYGGVGLAYLSMVLICLQYFIISFMQVISRRKTFTRDYMDRFSEEHRRALNSWKAPNLGYPDMGNGRYAADLTYKEWFLFNNM